MLTVLENPSDYNFSKSPVICEIETDKMTKSLKLKRLLLLNTVYRKLKLKICQLQNKPKKQTKFN